MSCKYWSSNSFVSFPSNELKAQKTPKEALMNTKFKTIVLGTLVAGSLVLSAGPVLARDDWHGRYDDHRWNGVRRDTGNDRRDLRQDYADLARARRQRAFDRRHHAGRRRLGWEHRQIHDLLNDIHNDRRDIRRERRGWFDWD